MSSSRRVSPDGENTTPAGESQAEEDGIYEATPGSVSPARWHVRGPRRRAELITDAHRTPSQNREHRQRVYLFLQLARIPLICLSLLTFLVWHNWWISLILFAISVPLPWIAVVIANEKGEMPDRRSKNVYKPAIARHEAYVAQESQLEASRRGDHSLTTHRIVHQPGSNLPAYRLSSPIEDDHDQEIDEPRPSGSGSGSTKNEPDEHGGHRGMFT